MKCPKCRSVNRDEAKFCNECGHQFDFPCPKCQTPDNVSSKFCDESGDELRQPSDTPYINIYKTRSGPVFVSAIGDDLRMDYTAVGDTTNLAARMEREARPGSIFVSKITGYP